MHPVQQVPAKQRPVLLLQDVLLGRLVVTQALFLHVPVLQGSEPTQSTQAAAI